MGYTVREPEADGYTAEISGDAETGFVITNVHTPEEPEEPASVPEPTETQTDAEPTPEPTESPTDAEPTPEPTETPADIKPTPEPTESPADIGSTPEPTESPAEVETTPAPEAPGDDEGSGGGTTGGSDGNASGESSVSPQTGDENRAALWTGIFALLGAALTASVTRRERSSRGSGRS